MAFEFERLVAYFDGDVSGVKTAADKATAIVDALENRIKNFRGDLKLNVPDNTRIFADISKQIQTANTHLENLAKTAVGTKLAPQFTEAEQAARKAAQIIAGFDNQLAKLSGNDTELKKLNRTLEQPGVAAKIDEATKALLRQKAAAIDSAKGEIKTKTGGVDTAYQKAQADIKRYQQQTASGEQALTRLVQQQAEQQYRARTKAIEKSANDYLKELKKISAAEKQAGSSSGGSGLFGAVLGGNIAAQAITRLTGVVFDGGAAILDYSSKLEQARVGLTTITGSADIANAHLKDLQNFAKTTPFEFSELVTASQKLQGVGFSAQQVIPVLKDVGSALAASGRIAELPFAIKALGDIQAKGRLAGQELIQLSNAGIPGIKLLADALGKTTAEVLALSESGQISSKVFLEALHRYSESNFGGALEAQSKTFQGAISNIKDALGQTAEVAFRPLYQEVSNIANKISVEVGKENQTLQDIGGIIARSVIIGFKDVIKNELTAEIAQIRKNLAEGKPSGISTPFDFGASLAPQTALPQQVATAYKFRFNDFSGATQADLQALKDTNYFGEYDAIIKKLEAEKQATQQKLIDAITFRGTDFSPTATSKKITPLQIESNKADLSKLTQDAKQAEQILKSRYAVEAALLDSSVRYTSDQEKQYIAQSFALKARAIQAEISQQSGFFNKQIQLNEGNTVEIEKLESDKSLTLERLNNDLKLNSIARAKEIAAIERKSYEERRQAAIEFQNLRVQEVNFQVDNEISDIQRSINERNDAVDGGYARLLEITNKGYGLVLQATRESLALQLQDQSLTDEQRNNLIRKGYLEEAKLAEDNRRNIVSIQDRQKQEIISRLTEQFQTIQSLYQAQGDLVGSIAAKFFDPANFSANSNKGFQDIILGKTITRRADDAFGNYQALKASPESTEPQIKGALDAFSKLEAENAKFKASFQSLDPVLQGVYTVIGNLGNQLQTTAGTYENFDKIARLSLFAKQRTDLEAFNAEIELNQTLLRNAKTNYENSLNEKINKGAIERDQLKRADPGVESLALREVERDIAKAKKELEDFKNTGVTTNNEITRLEANSKKLSIGLTTLKTTQSKEQLDQAAQSVKGLREEIEKLRNGDVAATNATLFAAEKADAAQTEATLKNIIALKSQIEKFKAGDKETVLTAREAANAQLLQQQLGSYQQLIYLKQQLANYDKTEQLQIQIAAEERLLEIRRASTEQAIAANRTIQDRVNLTLAQLPTYGTQIKDFFGQLPESIGNIFTNATQQWDGTFKGFFKSIGVGFAQLLQQLAADLLRAQVIKLISSLFGSLLGGIGGASFGSSGAPGNYGDPGHFFAAGGLITGAGTPTSDSIPLYVSNGEFVQQAKAVDYYGVDFMKMVNELKLPHQIVNHPLQFADGGFITGAGTATSDSIPINASNGEYVQNAQAVDYYGVDFMNALNNLQLPKPTERQKFAGGGLVTSGPDIFVPNFSGNENANLQNNNSRSPGNRSGSGTTIINTINIPQTFNSPRGTIAPKSLKQSQEHALAGVSRGLRDK